MTHKTGDLDTGIEEEVSEDSVAFKSIAYREMVKKWDLLVALREGTEAMRDARELYLPAHKAERPEDYDRRLRRSFLFPGFDAAIRRIVAKPFSKAVTIQEEKTLPEMTSQMLTDTDGAGKTFHEFLKDVFDAGNQYGMVHVLVDFPTTPEEISLATERRLNAHPRLVLVKPDQLFGFKSEIVGGAQVLTEIRVFEQALVPFGKWGEKLVNFIRVIRENDWELHEQKADEEDENKRRRSRGNQHQSWNLVASGPHTFGAVPLLTYYVTQTDFLEAEPTHEHLAELNLAHWQSHSDQRNILHFARVPMMFARGFEKDEVENGFKIAPNDMIMSSSKDAMVEFIEHSGKAIESGQKDLDNLKDEMRALGLQPMMPNQVGDIKATGLAIDEAQSQSEIQSWLRVLELFGRRILEMSASWTNEKLTDDVAVKVFNDFSVGMSDKDAKLLHEMRTSKDIDQKTFLQEMQRRAIINEDADLDEIVAATEAEGANLANMTGEPGDEDLEPAGQATSTPHEHTADMPGGTAGEEHTHPTASSCGVKPDGTIVTNPHQHTEAFPEGEVCE